MLKRRCAIWAITRFVLSPSVEATKASARSIPAASRASISSAVPSVNCPPRSSQLLAWPRSSSAMASASSSRTETSFPSSSMELAIAEPTRPQPTIRTNIWVPQYIRSGRKPRQFSPAVSATGRTPSRVPSSPAGGAVRITLQVAFSTTYLVVSPTKRSRARPRPPRIVPPRSRLGSSAPRMIASTPRRRASETMAWPVERPRTIAVATSTPAYSSPTSFARARTRFAS